MVAPMTGRTPLVTVCVPTIGRSGFLRHTLEALKAQTYQDYEVLVLDNACPEDARQLLDGFAKEDPRVRVLRADERIPVFANFNRGIRAAAGEYVVFFHDDDVYLPTFIESELELLVRNPSVGFVGSNCWLIDDAGRVTRRRRLIRRTEIWSGRSFIRALIQRGRNVMSTQGIMYRAKILRAVGFDETLPAHFGDFIVLMRMAEGWDVALIAELLWKNRVHAGAGSFAIPLSSAIPLRTRLLRDYCAEYRSRWPDGEKFVRSVEQRLSRVERLWLLWGWLSATNQREAEACIKELGRLQGGHRIGNMLRLVDRTALSFGRRRTIVASLLRRLGNAFGA